MIRAHLATFPPRRHILRRVTDTILPQVDRLFIVLNGYDSVPGFSQPNLRTSSLFATAAHKPRPEYIRTLQPFAYSWPHANIHFDDYHTNTL